MKHWEASPIGALNVKVTKIWQAICTALQRHTTVENHFFFLMQGLKDASSKVKTKQSFQ